MKNEQQTSFHKKKLQAKEGAKIKLFTLLLIRGYLIWFITFLMDFFAIFFKSFALGLKF